MIAVGGLQVPQGVDLSPEARAAARERVLERERREVAEIAARYDAAMAERAAGGRFVAEPEFARVREVDEVGRMTGVVFGGILSGSDPSWLIVGSVGTGKTTVAQLVAEAWSREGGSVRYVSEADYFAQLKASFDDPGATERVMRPMTEAGLLVIDDVGKSAPTPWKAEELFRIIDHRWRNRMRTVATSNLTPRQLAGVVGEATASRLGSFRVVSLGGRDRRAS